MSPTAPPDGPTVETLRERIALLERVCGEAYQLAGEVGAPVRILDFLAAAANGDALPADSMLPVTADECDVIAGLRAQLARVRQGPRATTTEDYS